MNPLGLEGSIFFYINGTWHLMIYQKTAVAAVDLEWPFMQILSFIMSSGEKMDLMSVSGILGKLSFFSERLHTSIYLYKKEDHGIVKWFRASDAGNLVELLTL